MAQFIEQICSFFKWKTCCPCLRRQIHSWQHCTNEEDWIDPILGINGLMPLGQSDFFVSAIAAIGGFGVGSDLMWDVSVYFGYKLTDTFSTSLGYRYLDVDYGDGGHIMINTLI